MQFQLLELHVQHAIRETILHVRTSNCMSIGELHVEHAFWCIIRWVRSNSNNKMHVDKVWCFWICTSQSNLHVQHVILFLSDMHIEVSHMHFWHADRRCWMHVGHHIVKWTLPVILHVGHWNKFSILMTNMSYSLYYCMSDWYIFVTYCMSEMDIAGFCACLCCTSLCFQTTYFGGMWQCLNTCSVLVQSATSWSESPEIESHTCVWLFFTDFV